jgi:hypothetical protein
MDGWIAMHDRRDLQIFVRICPVGWTTTTRTEVTHTEEAGRQAGRSGYVRVKLRHV